MPSSKGARENHSPWSRGLCIFRAITQEQDWSSRFGSEVLERRTEWGKDAQMDIKLTWELQALPRKVGAVSGKKESRWNLSGKKS